MRCFTNEYRREEENIARINLRKDYRPRWTNLAHVDAEINVLNHDLLMHFGPWTVPTAGDDVMQHLQSQFGLSDILELWFFKVNGEKEGRSCGLGGKTHMTGKGRPLRNTLSHRTKSLLRERNFKSYQTRYNLNALMFFLAYLALASARSQASEKTASLLL